MIGEIGGHEEARDCKEENQMSGIRHRKVAKDCRMFQKLARFYWIGEATHGGEAYQRRTEQNQRILSLDSSDNLAQ